MSAEAQLQLPPLQRHPRFFYDGVIFLIERQFYRIPRILLLQSEFFRDMFESFSDSGDVEGNSEDKPICPEGVTTLEIESLLSLLHTSVVAGPPELSTAQLGAILHISTKWGFEQARNYAITQIEVSNISPLDRIEIAFKCIVPQWLVPAYKDLCTRSDPLSLDDAQRLGIVRYHIISKIREELKPGKVLAIQPVAASPAPRHTLPSLEQTPQQTPRPRPQQSAQQPLPQQSAQQPPHPPPQGQVHPPQGLSPPASGGSGPLWAICGACNGGMTCRYCHSNRARVFWTCPIEVDSELQKHKTELGLADD